jgi:hypothetical protein
VPCYAPAVSHLTAGAFNVQHDRRDTPVAHHEAMSDTDRDELSTAAPSRDITTPTGVTGITGS